MMHMKHVLRVLLLTSLRLTGVWSDKNSVFVYNTLGGSAILPCTNLVSQDCSLISWTFYKGGKVRYRDVVTNGQVRADSDTYSRLSLTSNCSLYLRDLRIDDAASYVCKKQKDSITDVYLSLLTITSPSQITDLQPGGNLSLSCILSTYYDAGSCKSYSSVFNLSWVAEDGTTLPTDSRYEMTAQHRCNITLVIKLQKEDNNKMWRCQLKTKENNQTVFQDFRSTFLFQSSPAAQNLTTSIAINCQTSLPISRIVLCVALPVMVIIVGIFTWRTDRKQLAKTSAAGYELKEFNY
ncbi:hypothetical protein EXN66_Car009042 [Channa argus]|uniref:Ig-like domain-containing protein n=1 Tax=Channa argus TaxID=215402 RepID=A0A6G1PTP8_CHAAH|nr:hypothetical protein EXN66_Car009042 [Channa argus]KAK2913084.1 hypothetical protein Q8A73_007197 [Channa argus]